MAEHTKAPWHLNKPDEFGDYTITSEKETLAIAVVTNGKMRELCGDLAEHQANAQLIAAAPEFLEVFEEMDEYLSSNKLNEIGSGSIFHKQMKEAIAKATQPPKAEQRG